VREWAEALLAVAHPIGEHVARGLFVVLELVRGLGERWRRALKEQALKAELAKRGFELDQTCPNAALPTTLPSRA
jgi:hypothetical protein